MINGDVYDDDRGPDRRVHRKPLYFPDRRRGFDRRDLSGLRGVYQASLRAYRDRPMTFLLVLATIIVFNYVDFQLTVRVLEAGGMELNPIMANLFAHDPVIAAIAKLGAVGGATIVLLSLRTYRRTLEVSLVLLLAYTALMFYHAGLAMQLIG